MTYSGETSIEDGVRDLVTDLVGVALTDRLGGEEEAILSVLILANVRVRSYQIILTGQGRAQPWGRYH